MLYVLICELDIHLNCICDLSSYNIISILLDTLYMQSSCTMRALVVQIVPSAHRGCAVNHRCIHLAETKPRIKNLRHSSLHIRLRNIHKNVQGVYAIISKISMMKKYMLNMRIFIFLTHSYKDPSSYLIINHSIKG